MESSQAILQFRLGIRLLCAQKAVNENSIIQLVRTSYYEVGFFDTIWTISYGSYNMDYIIWTMSYGLYHMVLFISLVICVLLKIKFIMYNEIFYFVPAIFLQNFWIELLAWFQDFEYSFFIVITSTAIEQMLWLNFEFISLCIHHIEKFVGYNLTRK